MFLSGLGSAASLAMAVSGDVGKLLMLIPFLGWAGNAHFALSAIKKRVK
jgi:hypothetical protein